MHGEVGGNHNKIVHINIVDWTDESLHHYPHKLIAHQFDLFCYWGTHLFRWIKREWRTFAQEHLTLRGSFKLAIKAICATALVLIPHIDKLAPDVKNLGYGWGWLESVSSHVTWVKVLGTLFCLSVLGVIHHVEKARSIAVSLHDRRVKVNSAAYKAINFSGCQSNCLPKENLDKIRELWIRCILLCTEELPLTKRRRVIRVALLNFHETPSKMQVLLRSSDADVGQIYETKKLVAGKAFEDGLLAYVPDITKDKQFKRLNTKKKRRYRSVLAVPIMLPSGNNKSSNIAVGAISIDSNIPHDFDDITDKIRVAILPFVSAIGLTFPLDSVSRECIKYD